MEFIATATVLGGVVGYICGDREDPLRASLKGGFFGYLGGLTVLAILEVKAEFDRQTFIDEYRSNLLKDIRNLENLAARP